MEKKLELAFHYHGEQHYSGASFLDYDRIIFEEFMERGVYLANECSKLEIFYNTVDRRTWSN